MNALAIALRVTSYIGIAVALFVFAGAALFFQLDETLTAALLLWSVAEVGRAWMTLRFVRRTMMEIRRRDWELVQPTQYYSDRR